MLLLELKITKKNVGSVNLFSDRPSYKQHIGVMDIHQLCSCSNYICLESNLSRKVCCLVAIPPEDITVMIRSELGTSVLHLSFTTDREVSKLPLAVTCIRV
jgi:hypothetical protein